MKCIFFWFFLVATSVVAHGADDLQPKLPRLRESFNGHLFTIAGSNTIGATLAPSWARAFLTQKGVTDVTIEPLPKDNEYRVQGYNGKHLVYIDIHAHGSSTGFTSLKDGSAMIAMSSRPIKSPELENLQDLGDFSHYSSEHVVAIDGLAVIVNPSNPISSLSVEQIAKIFAGSINDWQQLGGEHRPINLYARDKKSGTWDTFESLVLQDVHRLATQALRFESNATLSDRVANDPGGIGFVGLASVNNAKALAVVDGDTSAVKPLPMYVATEDYPLSRRLYLYTPTRPYDALAHEFASFAQHQLGQEIVEQVGFVSQNPKTVQLQITSGPPFYQALASQAQRLSINFRFQPNQAELDNKAKRDVRRIAAYLKQQRSHNLRIQLVGFSNKKDDPALAAVLSRLRATAVKLALFHHGIGTEAVEGFGDERPVAEGRGDKGARNDRVEVWVYPADRNAALEKFRYQPGEQPPTGTRRKHSNH